MLINWIISVPVLVAFIAVVALTRPVSLPWVHRWINLVNLSSRDFGILTFLLPGSRPAVKFGRENIMFFFFPTLFVLHEMLPRKEASGPWRAHASRPWVRSVGRNCLTRTDFSALLRQRSLSTPLPSVPFEWDPSVFFPKNYHWKLERF